MQRQRRAKARRTVYSVRRCDGSEWTRVWYRAMAEHIAIRECWHAFMGIMTVHEIEE